MKIQRFHYFWQQVNKKCVKIRRTCYFRLPPSIYEETNQKLTGTCVKVQRFHYFCAPPPLMKKLIKILLEMCENTQISLFSSPLLHLWKEQLQVNKKCGKIRRSHYFRTSPPIYKEINLKFIETCVEIRRFHYFRAPSIIYEEIKSEKETV